jgi:8-oxo-dGTP pyrophosphatase MutT (NUDIX family)
MVHSIAMSTGTKHFPGPRNQPRFVRLSQLHKLRECAQVAAVCYRIRNGEIEFLLVRTRGTGRWTFPKGSAEPGLTHAQAAALEAFEEAGVHGRIEEVAFARYTCRKRCGRGSAGKSAQKSLVINAHLCQVIRLGTPKEPNRNRTWFSASDAIQRLQEGRDSGDAAELARVVGRAVMRIEHLIIEIGRCKKWTQSPLQKDGLQKVQFEASHRGGRMSETSSNPYMDARLEPRQLPLTGPQRQNLLRGEVLQFSPGK